MNIEGLDKLEKTLNNASKNFDMEAEKAIGRVANYIIKNVKLKTPVAEKDGGTLRRSWQVKMPENLTRVIYNNVHYAPHVEFGHRCTSRGNPGFPASTRERPRENFFNTSRGQSPLPWLGKKPLDESESGE